MDSKRSLFNINDRTVELLRSSIFGLWHQHVLGDCVIPICNVMMTMLTMFQLGILLVPFAAKLLFCFSQIGVLSVALDPKAAETAEKSMQKADVNYIKLDNAQLRQQFPMVKVFDNSLALVEPEGGTLYADKGSAPSR